MPPRPDDVRGEQDLAEVELLGQDLLDVLPPLDGEASVGHHEVDPQPVSVGQHELLELEEVVLAEHVAVAVFAAHTVVPLKAFGCKGENLFLILLISTTHWLTYSTNYSCLKIDILDDLGARTPLSM